MAIAGLEMSLRLVAQHLGKGSTHPLILGASAVVLVALHVIDFAQDQERALQLEIDKLQKTVDAHKDIRELRGEERQKLLNSLTAIADTVDVAARVLPEVGQQQLSKVTEYDSKLSLVLASVEKIHAEYDAACRFDEDLDTVVSLVNHINDTMPHAELQQMMRNFRDNLAIYKEGER